MLSVHQFENKPTLKRKFSEVYNPSAGNKVFVGPASQVDDNSLHSDFGNVLRERSLQSVATATITPWLGTLKASSTENTTNTLNDSCIEKTSVEDQIAKKQKKRKTISWAPDNILCNIKLYHVDPEEKKNPNLMLITGPENRNLMLEIAESSNKMDTLQNTQIQNFAITDAATDCVPMTGIINSVDEIFNKIDISLLNKINPIDISNALNFTSPFVTIEPSTVTLPATPVIANVPTVASVNTEAPINFCVPLQSPHLQTQPQFKPQPQLQPQPEISLPQIIASVQRLLIANIEAIPQDKMSQIIASLKNLEMTANANSKETISTSLPVPIKDNSNNNKSDQWVKKYRNISVKPKWASKPIRKRMYERVNRYVPMSAAEMY